MVTTKEVHPQGQVVGELPHVDVRIVAAQDYIWKTRSSSRGEVIPSRVPVGPFHVTGEKQGYEPAEVHGVLRDEDNSRAEVVLKLVCNMATIFGVVSSRATGQGIAGAAITALGSDGSATTAARGAQAGSYSLKLLPGGYTISIVADGFSPVERRVTVQRRQVSTMDISLQPTNMAWISGTVWDEAGLVSGIIVKAIGYQAGVPTTETTTTTDATGHYSLQVQVPPSWVSVQVERGGLVAVSGLNVVAGRSYTVHLNLAPQLWGEEQPGEASKSFKYVSWGQCLQFPGFMSASQVQIKTAYGVFRVRLNLTREGNTIDELCVRTWGDYWLNYNVSGQYNLLDVFPDHIEIADLLEYATGKELGWLAEPLEYGATLACGGHSNTTTAVTLVGAALISNGQQVWRVHPGQPTEAGALVNVNSDANWNNCRVKVYLFVGERQPDGTPGNVHPGGYFGADRPCIIWNPKTNKIDRIILWHPTEGEHGIECADGLSYACNPPGGITLECLSSAWSVAMRGRGPGAPNKLAEVPHWGSRTWNRR